MTPTETHRDPMEAVAIIGMSARFPGAPDVDAFWKNLRAGVESITFYGENELLQAGLDPAVVRHPRFVPAKGVLEGVELFDAAFFEYTPKEAMLMDPQHRVFLECGWHALENAGYHGEGYPGLIGVFAGAGLNQYLLGNLLPNPVAGTGLCYDKDFLATRLSYKLNLKGPSIVVQTACSTSLIAVCQACQSLLTYQADMVVTGGVSVQLPIRAGYFHEPGGVLSPDGHCRAFDRDARGTVMGSGVGVVVLKRLSDALADGDSIRAVIRGFAANNDGSDKIGYMAPSIDGQAQAITMAQALAGVDADSISYIEAHGTGTELGDPIEMTALTQAFHATTTRRGFCAIGSVKTNIGHLDNAAGIAGLIKTTLALEHKEIPPSLHFREANPRIDFENSPFFVTTALTPWKAGAGPRRAGVSSFGIGGTNAHVVIEEAPSLPPSGPSRPWQLLPLSARSEEALDRAAADLARYLESHREMPLADVSYTLQVGRKAFPHRRTVACKTTDDAIAGLRLPVPERSADAASASTRPVVFLFSGDGGLPDASDLYRSEAAFRGAVDRCAAILGSEQLRQQRPALFTVQYALATLWMSWGIKPAAIIGAGAGEYVAACLSGVVSLEDALKLLLARDADRRIAVDAIARREGFRRPQIPFVSSSTGTWIAASEATEPAYWEAAAARLGVAAGVAAVAKLDRPVCLEVGPGDWFSSLVRAAGEQSASPAAVFACMTEGGSAGPDGERLVRILGELWALGVQPDWRGYRGGERRRRVPLPGYPFERKRFWVDPIRPADLAVRRPAAATADLSNWFHRPAWRRSAASVPSQAEPGIDGPVLVFADAGTLGARVAARLRNTGVPVIVVEAGMGYAYVDAERYTIDPGARADYVALLKDLRSRDRLPATVAHFWGVTADFDPIPADDVDLRHRTRGFYSLLYLAQAIGEVTPRTWMRIAVVANGLYDVTGGEPIVAGKATVLGPCRVIPMEFPTIACRSIDLDIDAALATDAHVDQVLAELPNAAPIVAYRAGRRWVHTYEPMRLEPIGSDRPVTLRDSGTYLVTGGTGGIGLVLARQLAQTLRARLILTSRTGLPPRAEWPDIQARGSSDGIARKIALVQEIEAAGGEVMIAAADVTDEASMRTVVDQAIERFGRIDGVIHAAGVAGGGMVQLKTAEAAAAVLAPKVEGSRVLFRVFKDREPDLLILCSSLTSVLGGVGQVDYCAANAYLDAFAASYSAATRRSAITINWPAWREVGMAVDTSVPENLRTAFKGRALADGLSNVEGAEVFTRIVARTREHQVAVCVRDLAAMLEQGASSEAPAEDAGVRDAAKLRAQVMLHPRPALQTLYMAPRTAAEERISAIWQDSIGITQVGIDDNFFDLGGDSLLAVRLMARVNEELGAEIPVAKLYEGLTVRFLAAQLERGAAEDLEPEIDDVDALDRQRDKARRQKDHQQRRRALMRR